MTSIIQKSGLYLDKSVSAVTVFCLYIGVACLAIVEIVVLIDIVVRQFGLIGVYSTEISGYMLVGIAFLPAAYTVRQGLFIRIRLLTDRLNSSTQRILGLVTGVIVFVVAILLAKSCWGLTLTLYHDKAHTPTVLAPPYYLPQMVTSVGLSLFIIVMGLTILQGILSARSNRR